MERKQKTKKGWIDKRKNMEKKDKRKIHPLLLICYN